MWNNFVKLVGYLVNDVEVIESKDEKEFIKFSIAVDRVKREKKETDFFSCIAFSNKINYLKEYGKKGSLMILDGRLKNNFYEKDGKKIYNSEIIVDNCYIFRKSNVVSPDTNVEVVSEDDIEKESEELPF